MYEHEVKAKLEALQLSWADFCKWIVGHTLSNDATGQTIYWHCDIQDFIVEMTTGITNADWD